MTSPKRKLVTRVISENTVPAAFGTVRAAFFHWTVFAAETRYGSEFEVLSSGTIGDELLLETLDTKQIILLPVRDRDVRFRWVDPGGASLEGVHVPSEWREIRAREERRGRVLFYREVSLVEHDVVRFTATLVPWDGRNRSNDPYRTGPAYDFVVRPQSDPILLE